MICNVCGTNKATVHVTEFVEGKVAEVHMCDKCSQEKEKGLQFPFTLNDLLSGLIQFTSGTEEPDELATLKCPTCGLGMEEIKKSGRVGCARCYETFSKFLIPLIQKVQGATHHVGKKPVMSDHLGLRSNVEDLQEKLKEQIAGEDYEQAALTRDKIRILQERLEGKQQSPKKRSARKKAVKRKGKSSGK